MQSRLNTGTPAPRTATSSAQVAAPTPTEITRLGRLLSDSCGVEISAHQGYLLSSRLASLLEELSLPSYNALAERIERSGDPRLRQRFVECMTTHETYWFREPAAFRMLRDTLLPRWAAERREKKRDRLRIWCGACSTGQEAYALAMVVDDFCKRTSAFQSSEIELVATDVSNSALAAAMAGRYGTVAMQRGFDDEFAAFKDRYFRKAGRYARVRPEVATRVRFRQHNLVEQPPALKQCDLIFLRNVIIYFSADTKRQLFDRISSALAPGGVFVLGGAETTLGYSDNFTRCREAGATFFVNRAAAGGESTARGRR